MTGAGTSVVERLAVLARLGAMPQAADGTVTGIARPLFTSAEYEARTLFASWARAANFTVAQDLAGNLFARRPGRAGGSERAPILIGSHLDTVHGGGAYDGAYGVVAALAVLEALEAEGRDTEHPLEAVAWAGEEGSRFPLGCLGSGAYAGANPLADLDRLIAADGESFPDARDGPFGLLRDVDRRDTFPRPAAYLELHIEQGPLLEAASAPLGVVTAIAGARRFRIDLVGERGHAGTLPMTSRKDALCAAAEIVLALEAKAHDLGNCVATVGYIEVAPNETNVVPGAVTMRVDTRSTDDARIDALEHALRDACARATRVRRVTAAVTPLERREAVPMDAMLRARVHEAIGATGERALDVPSGAGHDAMCIAAIAPAAMIFVPSAGGRSHVGDEYTAPADLERGTAMLIAAVVSVDEALAARRPNSSPMQFFICGSALRGQPDHQNLAGATLVREAKTAPKYRLHSVRDEHPGIYEVESGGVSIAGEVYEMSDEQHAHLISSEPPDLYEAPIELEDGTHVPAMIYPRKLIEERGFKDISHLGGWAAFKA